MYRIFRALPLAALLAACGTSGERAAEPRASDIPAPQAKGVPAKRPGIKSWGGYYKDDGPADEIPENIDQIPDAQAKWEPLHKPALRPYEVFGKRYVPHTSVRPHRERGVASWYGRKFHGQKTSIGEAYDMFAMTAAHPTLALPSYVRVTNLQNGRTVQVRVIDRGPFHAERIIDLSYAAAHRLGIIGGGSGMVEIESILPGDRSETTYAEVSPPPTVPLPAVTMPAKTGQQLPAGVYLQLGAFANAENADNLKLHLEREFDWLDRSMHIVSADALHRLQLGPFAARGEAEAVAEKIRLALGYKPAIVTR